MLLRISPAVEIKRITIIISKFTADIFLKNIRLFKKRRLPLTKDIVFGFLLFVMSINFLSSRHIKYIWSQNEAYLMRFQWLDSVNYYLRTGKILMYPPQSRLEDVSLGEDQGLPFILSILGRLTNIKTMDFGHFVRFYYLLFVTLGVATSILLYLTFKSFVTATIFYYYYLRTTIYSGGIDHHWLTGIFVPFYLAFLVLVLYRRHQFHPYWLVLYFLTAGVANVMREGNGVMALLMYGVFLTIIVVQEGLRRHLNQVPKKILLVALFLLVYSLPNLTLEIVRTQRNQVYFNGESTDRITHHGLWHNAFMGFSYIPNPYGITWSDGNVLPFVQKVNPQTEYLTNEYFAILRRLYFKIMWESPGFFMKNLLAKVFTLHEYLGTLFPKNFPVSLPQIVKNYSFYIILGIMYFVARKKTLLRTIFFLTVATIGVSSIPGLITVPMRGYLRGVDTAYLMVWVFLFAMLYTRSSNWLKGKHV